MLNRSDCLVMAPAIRGRFASGAGHPPARRGLVGTKRKSGALDQGCFLNTSFELSTDELWPLGFFFKMT